MLRDAARFPLFSVLWKAALAALVVIFAFQLSASYSRFPAIEQPAPPAPEAGSKYGDGTSIAEFINGTDKSWSEDRPTRAMVGYRRKNNLQVEDFCVFGFEPNAAFSDAIHRTVQKYRVSVRYLNVFTSTVPGRMETLMPIEFNKTTGKVISWGFARPTNSAPDVEASQAMMLDLGKFLNDALGETGPRGRVLMRVDMGGAEAMIVRDILPIICKHVLKLEIEYHTAKFGRKGMCTEWMLHYILSSPKCRPKWKRPEVVPEECDIWGVTENFE
jgi:hypothetical protein